MSAEPPQGKYDTPESRWAGVGPYYAMFPVDFSDHVVKKYTRAGATVLDPFAGRGTAVFSAAANERNGIGVELNPVGWVYSQAKLRTASKDDVIARLKEIGCLAKRRKSHARLPEFFSRCFSSDVLRFLLTVRKHLEWRHSDVDRTLMALLLVNMHGKREASLSNQMRQTKSMSPNYAVKWWRKRKLHPPEVEPIAFLERKIEWRFAKGVPTVTNSFVCLGDSTLKLLHAKERAKRLDLPCAKLLLTSPPYCGITNYHYDQWLRLWLLGGKPNTLSITGRHRGKFVDQGKYRKLLFDVFSQSKPLLARDAVIYVRTDSRHRTLAITEEVLGQLFPKKRMFRRQRKINKPTQTHLFRSRKNPIERSRAELEREAEVDIVLLPAA